AILLFRAGHIALGTVATALPMTWQITNMAGWVAQNVTGIFENVGIVQDGMRSIAVPRQMADAPGAGKLAVVAGEIRFDNVSFDYGRDRSIPVLRDIDLTIAPGERVGRRQIDAGQSAAALLRAGARPHPDRRTGHRAGRAGKPARPDRGGDAGHLAAAPLDQRQYPLRQAARDPGDDRGRGAPRRSGRLHPRSRGLAWTARL